MKFFVLLTFIVRKRWLVGGGDILKNFPFCAGKIAELIRKTLIVLILVESVLLGKWGCLSHLMYP